MATRTGKDSAAAARIPVAARRLASNSQKLITNLFHGGKGSAVRTAGQRQRKKELLRESSHNGTGTRAFLEKTRAQSCVSFHRCPIDSRWNFSPHNRPPLMSFAFLSASSARFARFALSDGKERDHGCEKQIRGTILRIDNRRRVTPFPAIKARGRISRNFPETIPHFRVT